ncbi:MAG: hypothetical protein AAF579_13335 [Cyanobacteria bacterium P01_C01_bin.118]
MSKFILGGILAAISLMAIYGTTASDQVISRIDGTERPKTQSNFGQNSDENGLVALNPTESTGSQDSSFVESSVQTPLEKAGMIPQRQTVGASPNFGATTTTTQDDTDGEVVEAPSPTPAPTTGGTTTTTPPATTAPAQNPAPIPALW